MKLFTCKNCGQNVRAFRMSSICPECKGGPLGPFVSEQQKTDPISVETVFGRNANDAKIKPKEIKL